MYRYSLQALKTASFVPKSYDLRPIIATTFNGTLDDFQQMRSDLASNDRLPAHTNDALKYLSHYEKEIGLSEFQYITFERIGTNYLTIENTSNSNNKTLVIDTRTLELEALIEKRNKDIINKAIATRDTNFAYAIFETVLLVCCVWAIFAR